MPKNISSNPTTMEELLASQTKKLITLFRGQQVEGIVVSITDKEIILDLGAKSEGVLQKRELTDTQIKDLKLGSTLSVFVSQTENESGQVILSLQKQTPLRRFEGARGFHFRGGKSMDWKKFFQAQNQKSKMQGVVLEINKGGLIVEVLGVRGFLPNSQVGFELLSKSGEGLEKLIGQTLSLTVIEVDSDNNKLIFTQRGQVSDDLLTTLKGFKQNQKVSGTIIAILPFGLVVSVKDRSSSGRDDLGVEGLVFISDVSWERQEDLSKTFSVGQELQVLVIGIDESLGRLNLSIKQLSEDPFSKLSEIYPADEVVKGEITGVSEEGVWVKLDKAEGFLPASKMDAGTKYESGKNITVLVDSVDIRNRRINLAPFITSTEGLIYK